MTGVNLDPLGVDNGIGDICVTATLQNRTQQCVVLIIVRAQGDVVVGRLVFEIRWIDEVLPALAFIDARWSNVLEGGLPAVKDGPSNRPIVSRRNLQRDRPRIFSVDERHQVNRVGIGSQRLVFPVGKTGPIDDLIESSFCPYLNAIAPSGQKRLT